MATCNQSDVLAAARPFVGLMEGQLHLAMAGLLVQLIHAINPMATCDANTVLEQARLSGFTQLLPGQLSLVTTQLLCNLSGGGTGGGTGQLLSYTDGTDPTSIPAPTNTSMAAMAYPASGVGSVYTWNTTTQAWQ